MIEENSRVLVIGYGNPGRLDDGLGPALASALEAQELPSVTVDSNYQLFVEDAAAIAEHDVVIFVDASINGAEPFEFNAIQPKATTSFSSHSIEPQAVLALAHDMFDARTTGYVLGIRGYKFDAFGEFLSRRAKENLSSAKAFILRLLLSRRFDGAGLAGQVQPLAGSSFG